MDAACGSQLTAQAPLQRNAALWFARLLAFSVVQLLREPQTQLLLALLASPPFSLICTALFPTTGQPLTSDCYGAPLTFSGGPSDTVALANLGLAYRWGHGRWMFTLGGQAALSRRRCRACYLMAC